MSVTQAEQARRKETGERLAALAVLYPESGDEPSPSGAGDESDSDVDESTPFGRDDLEWVYLSLGVEEIDEDSAPNMGAVAWLRVLRANPGALADFYRNIMPRLLPKEIRTSEAGREFVGAKQVEQCDEILRKLKFEAVHDTA